MLARVVCNTTRLDSSSETLLRNLHWLPISQRIKFKIAVLTFKTLHIGQPSYLADNLSLYNPSRNLRSSTANLLIIPDIRSEVGRNSFAYSAPTIWNSLPQPLRDCTCLTTFRKQLKSHLFAQLI